MTKKLSPLQVAIAERLCEGYTTKELAEHLSISENTTQNIISTIMLKLQAKTRAELASKCVAGGIVRVKVEGNDA